MDNLVGQAGTRGAGRELDGRLQAELQRIGDDFRPGPDYIAEWGYEIGPHGSVPYGGPRSKPQTPRRRPPTAPDPVKPDPATESPPPTDGTLPDSAQPTQSPTPAPWHRLRHLAALTACALPAALLAGAVPSAAQENTPFQNPPRQADVRGADPATGGPPDAYNVVWESPSSDASESMPCGGGDTGLNVWVEDGDVLFYIQRSGSLAETNEYLKLGRVRLRLDPNPFASPAAAFRQELKLREGAPGDPRSAAGEDGEPWTTTVRIWVEVKCPVIHVEVEADQRRPRPPATRTGGWPTR